MEEEWEGEGITVVMEYKSIAEHVAVDWQVDGHCHHLSLHKGRRVETVEERHTKRLSTAVCCVGSEDTRVCLPQVALHFLVPHLFLFLDFNSTVEVQQSRARLSLPLLSNCTPF